MTDLEYAEMMHGYHMEFFKNLQKIDRLLKAAQALLADVKERHPGEELRCPHMCALWDAAQEFEEE